MYARYIVLGLGPNTRALAEEIADAALPHYRSQHGFKSVTFLIDDASGDCGSLSLWESQADGEQGGAAMGAWLRENYGGKLIKPPEARLYAVYESNA